MTRIGSYAELLMKQSDLWMGEEWPVSIFSRLWLPSPP